ncbi:MAG: hypothetical protein M3Y59_13310, partial [Myxococcota bacterium]|nr:hypothetical protein [Myxococcota bacterium]
MSQRIQQCLASAGAGLRCLLPALALLGAGHAAASTLPTLRTISVDGQFSDWNQILLNPLQVTVDGNASITNTAGCYPTNPDRDCTNLSGTGRDILTFAWTYDPTYIYTYLRRDASSNSVMNYFFIMDLNANGLAESTDRVAQVRWSGGGNALAYLRVFAYVPAVPGGDPMACTSAANCPSPGAVGYVDGYSMP